MRDCEAAMSLFIVFDTHPSGPGACGKCGPDHVFNSHRVFCLER